MFDFLTQKFSSIFSGLTGKKNISEANISETLDKIRNALLEADVPFSIIDNFINNMKKDIIGENLEKSLKPGEQFAKLVHDNLTQFMGGSVATASYQIPSVIMTVGLQGAGKTTSLAKIANYIKNQGQKRGKTRRILLGSVDFYRPAAIDQLEILSKKLNLDFYRANSTDPLEASREIYNNFRNNNYEYLLLDTAGRSHIDNDMLLELKNITSELNPKYKILVLDAMTGQESLKIAQAFDSAIEINSAILTKMDSDVRGGVAFAFSYAVKKPISFIGTGEKIEDLEQFYPDRMATRILGMGDIQSLVENAESKISEAEKTRMESSFKKDKFTLQDFADQMSMVNKMGSLSKLAGYMPMMGNKLSPEQLEQGEKELIVFKAIIGSMTPKERAYHKLLDGSRINRIAKGSGVTPKEVNSLLKKFEQSQQFVKLLKKPGALGKLKDLFK